MISASLISKAIIEKTRAITGDGEHHLHVPSLTDLERQFVAECIDEGFVSSMGQKIKNFENELMKYTGARNVIAVSSGTAALHMALIGVGVKSNDEVLLPALTFAASGHAILYCGAVPHFVESCSTGFGIDHDTLREYLNKIVTHNDYGEAINKKTGRVIRALMAVHIFGHIADIEALKNISDEFNIPLIEDAAEALGSWATGTHAGLHGKIGALSFNGNKIITTGGGGCILTNDDGLADYLRHIATTAKKNHPYDYYHSELGYNYRMPNLNAALGVAQIYRLESFLESKINLSRQYQHEFSSLDECELYIHPNEHTSNYWLQTIVLFENNLDLRNQIIDNAHKNKLFMRPIWRLLSTLPAFGNCPKMDLSTAKSLANRTINLPSSCYLGMNHE